MPAAVVPAPDLGELLAEVRRLRRDLGRPAPRLLTQVEAAAYCGLGVTLFAQLVAGEDLPRGRKVPARTKAGGRSFRLMWRRTELDKWLDDLPPGESRGRNPVTKGGAAA